MSHIPQRQEKDCLNCGAIVQGRYCQECGQENVVPHETFWHMAKHFLYDITHFDSKFFDSMKYLLFRPGFLPAEYVRGRRASYLHPIKKYVFTSAIFFLLFFSFFLNTGHVEGNLGIPLTSAQRAQKIQQAERALLKKPGDAKWTEAMALLRDSSRVVTETELQAIWEDFDFINLSDRHYRNKHEYDSVQASLPARDRDDWFTRLLQKRNLKLKEKYGSNPKLANQKLVDVFLHKLPYLLFISLPVFALLLKLLYIRRKEFYYADHGVFSIYHYIFTFILLIFVFLLGEIEDITHFAWLDIPSMLLFLSGGIYLYLSMKRFYKQGHGKTLLKFLLLNIGGAVTLILLFVLFILLAVFEI